MSNLSDERLSSLLDGELDDTQRRHAIDALSDDAAARRCWERFHLASDALHGNLPESLDLQFSDRVMAAIEAEPTVLAPPPRKPSIFSRSATHAPSSFSKRFAGLAVAVSVAAMAVMGVETLYRNDSTAPLNQQIAKANASQPELFRLAKRSVSMPAATLASVNVPMAIPSLAVGAGMPGTHASMMPRRIDPRLHKYLINHNQQTARSNIQGMMPYARIVTYPGVQRKSVQR